MMSKSSTSQASQGLYLVGARTDSSNEPNGRDESSTLRPRKIFPPISLSPVIAVDLDDVLGQTNQLLAECKHSISFILYRRPMSAASVSVPDSGDISAHLNFALKGTTMSMERTWIFLCSTVSPSIYVSMVTSNLSRFLSRLLLLEGEAAIPQKFVLNHQFHRTHSGVPRRKPWPRLPSFIPLA
jgi:hypothetical protein